MISVRFDVYGTLMQIERDDLGWRLFRVGAEGKRSPVQASIPDSVTEAELGQFLDDLFHEGATPSHPTVTRVR